MGTGTFLGSQKSHPKIGVKGKIERVEEVKIEVLVNTFDLNKVIAEMKKIHPYEEVAYDVYPVSNENVNYGMGVIGELEKELSEKEFLDFTARALQIKNFRFSRGKKNKIKKVAVCGGSCSDLIDSAINKDADAFITADIKYHSFQDAENKILLIDAGHYETEIALLDELKNRIIKSLTDKTKVFKYKGSTNPVVFYNNQGARKN
jgi:putative NIF3 family GTP cyclohydrolase 1 type 2